MSMQRVMPGSGRQPILTMEQMQQLRAAQTPNLGQMGPSQGRTPAGQVGNQPHGPVQPARPPQPKPYKLYLASKNEACRTAYAAVANNPAVADAVDVVNVDDRSKRPVWLKGVPALHQIGGGIAYGTQAIVLMNKIAASVKSTDFDAPPSTHGCAFDGTCAAPNALDYGYEYASESGSMSMESIMAARQAQDNKVQKPASTSTVDFQIQEDRTATNMDELMAARARTDSRVQAQGRSQMFR